MKKGVGLQLAQMNINVMSLKCLVSYKIFRFCFRQLFIQMDSRGQGIVGFPLLQAALYAEYCIDKQTDVRLQPLIRTKV